MKQYIGFDIGGTSIKWGVVSQSGKILEKDAFKTLKKRKQILNDMAAVVVKTQKHYELSGVGISAPGIVRKDGYMITGGAIDEFFDFALADTFQKMVKLPVRVENDANAAALAEHWLGNAQNIDNYVCVVLGTGVGGGIVCNGDIYRGAHGMAGEFGWNIIRNYDRAKKLEDYSLNWSASVVNGLVKRYNESMHQVDPEWEDIEDARIILTKGFANDIIATPVVNEFLESIAVMILNLFSHFDPEVILVGGGISANQEFMEHLNAKVSEFISRHHSLNGIRETALGHVEPTKLRNDSGLIGAVYPLVRPVLTKTK